MQKIPTSVAPSCIIVPARIADDRGFLSETFNSDIASLLGAETFVQDNHSYSQYRGIIRGLHYQVPPLAQAKLVRVTCGAILDVAVDLRFGSPTYGQYFSTELSRENWKQLFIPVGFAHGFCTLTEDVDIVYKVSRPYSKLHERGVRWDDPTLNIAWPVGAEEAILSVKDRNLPLLADIEAHFHYEG